MGSNWPLLLSAVFLIALISHSKAAEVGLLQPCTEADVCTDDFHVELICDSKEMKCLIPIGDSCEDDTECAGHSKCPEEKCMCEENFIEAYGRCYPKVGAACEDDCVPGSDCTAGVCACMAGKVENDDMTKCGVGKLFHEECDPTTDVCTGDDLSGYHFCDSNKKMCLRKLNEFCDGDTDCGAGSHCNQRCICAYYETEAGAGCMRKHNEYCDIEHPCVVGNECGQNGMCGCKPGLLPRKDRTMCGFKKGLGDDCDELTSVCINEDNVEDQIFCDPTKKTCVHEIGQVCEGDADCPTGGTCDSVCKCESTKIPTKTNSMCGDPVDAGGACDPKHDFCNAENLFCDSMKKRCVKKIGEACELDNECPFNGMCDEEGEVSKCACNKGLIPVNDNTMCEDESKMSSDPSAALAQKQCPTCEASEACNGKTGVCEIKIGQACESGGEKNCASVGMCDEGTSKCMCPEDSPVQEGDTVCAKKVGSDCSAEDKCVTGSQCSSKNSQCTCSSGQVPKDDKTGCTEGIKKGLNEDCDASNTKELCFDSLVTGRDLACDSKTQTCLIIKKIGMPCGIDDICMHEGRQLVCDPVYQFCSIAEGQSCEGSPVFCSSGSYCSAGTCVCDNGHTKNEELLICEPPKTERDFGLQCSETLTCKASLTCINGRCLCDAGKKYDRSDKTCKDEIAKTYGDMCSGAEDCGADSNLECQNSACVCMEGKIVDLATGKCKEPGVEVKRYGSKCNGPSSCASDSMECKEMRCQCTEKFIVDINTWQCTVLKVGSECRPTDMCADYSKCMEKKCVCPRGYIVNDQKTACNLDPCLINNPCQNGGNCYLQGMLPKCDCQATAYIGERCETKPSSQIGGVPSGPSPVATGNKAYPAKASVGGGKFTGFSLGKSSNGEMVKPSYFSMGIISTYLAYKMIR